MRNPIAILLLVTPALAATHPITENLGGVPSLYTDRIAKLAQSWPPGDLADFYANPKYELPLGIQLRCFLTPDHEFYIGAQHGFVIRAPLARVAQVLEDFAGEAGIFDGLEKSEVREHQNNRWTVFTEQNVPLPFVSNERTEMIYQLNDGPLRKLYRYQLKKSNHLVADDGLIVIEELGPQETRFTEFDFFDAEWGIAKTLAPGRIWKDSLEGLIQSDLATRLKAENPQMPEKEILKQSKDAAGRIDFSSTLKRRESWPETAKKPGA